MNTVNAEGRSRMMSRVRGRDTGIELAVRPVLEALGFVYQPKGVTGRPDFVHLVAKVSMFLDGCFWHGCPEQYKEPEDHSDFWRKKVERNRRHDTEVTAKLESEGWRVIRVWEHDLRHILAK